MTSLEQSSHPLADELGKVFANLVDQGAVDIVAGDQEDSWELQADQWTLALEAWPLRVAFLAIDEEPSGAEELRIALHAALGPGDLVAMRELDHRLDGALGQALDRSGDALSSELAQWLADEHQGGKNI